MLSYLGLKNHRCTMQQQLTCDIATIPTSKSQLSKPMLSKPSWPQAKIALILIMTLETSPTPQYGHLFQHITRKKSQYNYILTGSHHCVLCLIDQSLFILGSIRHRTYIWRAFYIHPCNSLTMKSIELQLQAEQPPLARPFHT